MYILGTNVICNCACVYNVSAYVCVCMCVCVCVCVCMCVCVCVCVCVNVSSIYVNVCTCSNVLCYYVIPSSFFALVFSPYCTHMWCARLSSGPSLLHTVSSHHAIAAPCTPGGLNEFNVLHPSLCEVSLPSVNRSIVSSPPTPNPTTPGTVLHLF